MPLPDPPDLISLFVAPLNQLGVMYMVTGSLAASAYGEPRLTNDIDLVLILSESDAARLHDAFDSSAFYVPPIEAIEMEQSRARYGHFNVIHSDSALKADVYLAGDDPLSRWGLAHREHILVEAEPVWMAPPEYVIVRKLQYYRDGGSSKHLADIRAMVAVLGDRLDRKELLDRVVALGVEQEWISL
ncbi:MAG: hypothetical protein ACR2KM_02275 [Gemmatimonadaceae bacterium]